MKTELNQPKLTNTYQAQSQLLDKNKVKVVAEKVSDKKEALSPDYKLDLSLPPKPPMPSLPTAAPSAPSVETPKPDEKKKPELPEVKKVEAPKIKEGSLKKPGIFFIKGLDIFSSPSKSEGGYAGMGRIAESVEGSRIYGWDQKSEIIDEIKKIHKDYPVILVGHSLGGDTAMEIANSLDSLDHKFRPVDLLITVDAVGFNNDIVPQNVKNHLNIFGENNFFLNDGPHVARRNETTSVTNILSNLEHTELDDDKQLQFEVVGKIEQILSKAPKQKLDNQA